MGLEAVCSTIRPGNISVEMSTGSTHLGSVECEVPVADGKVTLGTRPLAKPCACGNTSCPQAVGYDW